MTLPQHPDEHRSECPILLAVDQQLGDGATLRVAPELGRSARRAGGQGRRRTWTSSGASRRREGF